MPPATGPATALGPPTPAQPYRDAVGGRPPRERTRATGHQGPGRQGLQPLRFLAARKKIVQAGDGGTMARGRAAQDRLRSGERGPRGAHLRSRPPAPPPHTHLRTRSPHLCTLPRPFRALHLSSWTAHTFLALLPSLPRKDLRSSQRDPCPRPRFPPRGTSTAWMLASGPAASPWYPATQSVSWLGWPRTARDIAEWAPGEEMDVNCLLCPLYAHSMQPPAVGGLSRV